MCTQSAIACSPRFPLEAYIVTVVGVVSVSYPVDAQLIAGKDMISLNVSGPGLLTNEIYSVFVSACISVTCRHSDPVQFSEFQCNTHVHVI